MNFSDRSAAELCEWKFPKIWAKTSSKNSLVTDSPNTQQNIFCRKIFWEYTKQGLDREKNSQKFRLTQFALENYYGTNFTLISKSINRTHLQQKIKYFEDLVIFSHEKMKICFYQRQQIKSAEILTSKSFNFLFRIIFLIF